MKKIKDKSLYVDWDRKTDKLKIYQMSKVKATTQVREYNMKLIATFENVQNGIISK
tara:strand:+ start:469 stop:636 length:168 start_codon:yes stop_codon:yes gene_type:complete